MSITGVHYTVSGTPSALGAGPLAVEASYTPGGLQVGAAGAADAVIGDTTSGTGGSGGRGGPLTVTADSPPVTVEPSAYDAPISPIGVASNGDDPLPSGYVCFALSGSSFDSAAVPQVRVTTGDETVEPNATFQGTAATGSSVIVADVTSGSSGPGGFSISGLMVNASPSPGPVSVTVTSGTNPSCAGDTTSDGSATAFTVASGTAVTQIYGSTPDATAAAELEHQFDAEGTACPGRTGARPVVLATDAQYPDALSSAYLASDLQTGELLTPTLSLSAATVDALREEGITNVYVVGGPLAVSTAVVQQLESTLAYKCGGASPITAADPVYLQVTRIYGQTQYDTAEWVAEYPNATNVGSADVAGAYGTTNRSGGMGRYNDTTGTASGAPATANSYPTAIVATGRAFQDAESASVLSYAEHLPILLTTTTTLSPQVSAAVSALQIKQVIVMGGPLAVTNAVVTSLEALGLSVLRIAGQTDTDTSVQLADFEMASSAGHEGLAWAATGRVAVARGNYYTDGLAGAVVAAGQSHTGQDTPEPLVLTADPSTVGPYLTSFLEQAGTSGIDDIASDVVDGLTVLGGPDAVTPAEIKAMQSDL